MSLLPEISQASAEINKLVAQANIHQTIARVDPAAFTDPADTLLLASRDPVIREVSVGMTGVEAASYTVSGTPPLSLPNSIGKPLKAWSVDVLPYQVGTGDPSPDNVRPIHGTDKLNITTAGKNLYNMALQVTDSSNSFYGFAPINNTDYTFTVGIVSRGIYVAYSDDELMPNLTSNNWTRLTVIYNNTTISFNSGTHKWVRITIYMADGLVDTTYQLEYGSTSTDYTPYVAPSTTVLTLPQTVYTSTIGSEGGESRTAIVDLSTLNWGRSTSYADPIYYAAISGMKNGVSSEIDIMCEGLNPLICQGTSSFGNTAADVSIAHEAGNSRVLAKATAYSTVAEFMAAMSGVKLVYPLAAPTTFAVPSVTIPTPTGTATTWATAEDGTVDTMEVTYIGKA